MKTTQRLNVCIVHPNRNAYSETFILNHIEYLPVNVFDVYGSYWPQFDGDDNSLIDFYIRRSFITWIFFYSTKLLPFFIFNRLPASVTCLPKNDQNLQRVAFRYFLKKNKIDAVLAEYGFKGTIVYKLCEELNIPLIVHFHGYDAHNQVLLQRFEEEYKKMFKNVFAIIVVSEYMKQAILNLGAPGNKVHLIHYGVNIELFKASSPQKNPPVFVSVGRFADTKAPQLTIMAFAKVLQSCIVAKLIMIGDGPLLESCKTISCALKIDDSIEFMGIQTPAQVAEIMHNSRAFILHSIITSDNDAEGTPNVILEASSSALPIVSTLHAGIPDVVIHGETGFLVKEKDIDAMAEYMIRLANDGGLSARMGAEGRKRIEQHFQLSEQINKLMNIIQTSTQ
ncbi:MAG: glycosyltransferase [Ferruginibacter sp.]